MATVEKPEPAYYDVEVVGPEPDDGAAFVLIAYDRGPFGFTAYSVDSIEETDGLVRGYRAGRQVVKFKASVAYVLINRQDVRLLPQTREKPVVPEADVELEPGGFSPHAYL